MELQSSESSQVFGSPQWTEGGDALTNFAPGDFHLYYAAIRRFGDDSLYIGKPTPNGVASYFALRQHGRPYLRADLSDFWRVFDGIRAELQAAMTAARS